MRGNGVVLFRGTAMAEFENQKFNYIIVGGGAAGCVVASRLSERSQNKILLLEAGEDFIPGTEPLEIQDTFAATAHSNPRFTWRQNVTFSPKPSNAPDTRKKVRYAQGHVIGGGSSVNGMISIRGLPTDYDGWVERGAKGWVYTPRGYALKSPSRRAGPAPRREGKAS